MNSSVRVLRPIFAAWVSAGVLLGQGASRMPVAPHPLTQIPFVKTGCLKPKGTGGSGWEGRLRYLDIGKSNGGDLFLERGRELYQWKQTSRGQRLLEVRSVPSPPTGPPGAPTTAKFRAGTFWGTDGKRVVQWESLAQQWVVALTPTVEFDDFEIAPDGSILLLTTSENLIEVFRPGDDKPASTIPFPTIEMEPEDRPLQRRIWMNLRTAVCDEHVVIYASDNGRLLDYDTYTRRLRPLSVPWEPLELKGLARRARSEGRIYCNGFPSGDCIQMIPDLALSVKVVFSLRPFTVVKPGSSDPQRRSLPEIKYVEGSDQSLKSFDWSLADGTKSEVQRDTSLTFPLWLNGAGDLVPLDPLIEKYRQSEPPASSKEKKPGKPPRTVP